MSLDFTSAYEMHLKTSNNIDIQHVTGMRRSLIKAIDNAAKEGYYQVEHKYGVRPSASNTVNDMLTDLKKAGYTVVHSTSPQTDSQLLIHTLTVGWERR